MVPRPHKHCSIITRKGRIISIGTNIRKTHPLAQKMGYLFDEVHSELDAHLRCKDMDSLTLWNFRFNNLGEMRMAKPCVKCQAWCGQKFDHIWYSTNEGVIQLY